MYPKVLYEYPPATRISLCLMPTQLWPLLPTARFGQDWLHVLVVLLKVITCLCVRPPPMTTKLSELIDVAQAPKAGEEGGRLGPWDQVEEPMVSISMVVAEYSPPMMNTSPESKVTVEA